MTKRLCLHAPPPPNPPLSFYAAQACFQEHRIINTTCFTSIIVLELFKPITLAVHLRTAGVCNWGGGGLRPTPTPPLFILRLQICFQEHGTINQNCFKNQSCRQMGGYISHFLNLCKIASSIILPAETETIWTLSEPVIKKIYDEPG